MLVTLQSSLPDLFCDTRFTVGQPDHFLYIYGSGSGSHTHLKKFMRLLSVHWSSSPQLKLVESVGNVPTSTCLQGKCIACLPRPRKKFMILDLRFTIWQAAVVLPHAREVLETLLHGWCAACGKIVNRKWNGAVAGNRTRTCSLARSHSAVKSQPRN